MPSLLKLPSPSSTTCEPSGLFRRTSSGVRLLSSKRKRDKGTASQRYLQEREPPKRSNRRKRCENDPWYVCVPLRTL